MGKVMENVTSSIYTILKLGGSRYREREVKENESLIDMYFNVFMCK